jgi:hypothetical protein
MSDFTDGFLDYEPEGEDNPFWDLEGWDEASVRPDPYERMEREVLDAMGIESFDAILLDATERDLENMRGNRFESLQEAITYLFDAGILQFSGVVIGADELEIEVESDTGRSGKK